MKKFVFFTIITLVIFNKLWTQDPQEILNNEKGKFILKCYSNFFTTLNSSEIESAFEIKRAYLGYKYQLSDKFSTIVKLDIGSPNDESQYALLRRYAYFKNAALTYSNNKIKWNFGLVDLLHFKIQEKFWGHRYIYKSFNDEYGFGSSADIGTNIIYDFNSSLSGDFSVFNGEGYTKLQVDNTYKAAVGLTYKYKKLLISRIYIDYTEKSTEQVTISSFIGLNYKKLSLGVEYNDQLSCDYIEDHNKNGGSIYTSFDINEKWQIFARYDILTSKVVNGYDYGWNQHYDGQLVIGGVQFCPVENVKIAANYRCWLPDYHEYEVEQYFYINFEYKIN
ncbi:MAG: hypothetical protein Kow0068_02730 [Marinilabiliales bacterium]